MEQHLLSRSLHDVGLAGWFGGSLMGAVGLNGATASLRDPSERATASTAGWSRWAPVNAAAVGAHLIGAARLLYTERDRVKNQQGVGLSSAVKTALTAAAVGTTAYSGVLNRKMAAAGPVRVQGATEPGLDTPPDVAATQKQLKAIQWAIPALTGGLVVATAWQGEQMRPSQVAAGGVVGTLNRVTGSAGDNKLPLAGIAAGVSLLAALRSRRSKSRSTSESAAIYPVSTGTSTTTYGATGTSSPTVPASTTSTPTSGTTTSGTSASGTSTLGTSTGGTSTGGLPASPA